MKTFRSSILTLFIFLAGGGGNHLRSLFSVIFHLFFSTLKGDHVIIHCDGGNLAFVV